MAPSASHIPNLHAYRGRRLLSELTVIPDRDPVDVVPSPASNLPVCIIGAGIAGLYTAMIFQSLGIEYQIVDADTQDRVGGRLFTYHFPNGDPYDYLVCWIPVFSHRVLIFAYRRLELCGSQIHPS